MIYNNSWYEIMIDLNILPFVNEFSSARPSTATICTLSQDYGTKSLWIVSEMALTQVASRHRRCDLQYIPKLMCTIRVCWLLPWLVTDIVYPYSPGLFHRKWGNDATAPLPVKHPKKSKLNELIRPTLVIGGVQHIAVLDFYTRLHIS